MARWLAIVLLSVTFSAPMLYAQEPGASAVGPLIELTGPSFISSSFSAAAAALEQPLLAILAAKDKKAGEAAAVALRSQRQKAEELERKLVSAWSAWTESLSAQGAPKLGLADPLSSYDRAAHAATLSSLRLAENAALIEAQKLVAKAASAKGFNASAIRLLNEYERRLALPPSLRAGVSAIAALKTDQLKILSAAALCGRPLIYIESLSAILPSEGRKRIKSAAEAFASSIFGSSEGGLPESVTTADYPAMFAAALALGAAAGDKARSLGLYYSGADFYGFLTVLLLARPQDQRDILAANGMIRANAYSVLNTAFDYIPWPSTAPNQEQFELSSSLYTAWLSAQLRKHSIEASRFALLSTAPAIHEVLALLAAEPHRAALDMSFERYWLEAREALALDLRADTLLWLRSIGQKPLPDALALDIRVTRWPKLPYTAGIELLVTMDGKNYAVPHAAIAASLQASLKSVFGSELPAYVYIEARGSASEAFVGPALRGELALEALGEELSSRYARGMAWSVEAWMEPYMRESMYARSLARLYAQTAEAARIASEPWYAALSARAGQRSQP